MSRPRVLPDEVVVEVLVAGEVAAALAAAIAAREIAHLMVSGGRTPVGVWRRLAAGGARAAEWPRVHIWFTDERAVPPDDEASNFRLVSAKLATPAGIPPDQVHRMPADLPDLDAAATAYASLLPDVMDLVVLGLGEDAHIASLFPGSPLIDEPVRRVAPVQDAPKPPPRRLTVTPLVLTRARRVLVLATGAAKAAAVAAVHAPRGDAHATPGRLVRDREWYVDHEAASALAANA